MARIRLTPEERRRRAAAKQDRLRARRAQEGKCRRCSEPVAVSARTGRPARMCRKHLDEDGKRKDDERELGGRPLRWHDDPRIAYGQRGDSARVEHDLPWFDDASMHGVVPTVAPWPADWPYELVDESACG